MRKTETMDLQWKDYAKVPTRIKEFREDCPNGLIETEPTFLPDWQILFKARILKDKENPNSAEGTGHSIGKLSKDKAFEKLETIAIGRALAVLWYMASGEIASSEEMEEFIEYQKTKQQEELEELIEQTQNIKTMEELKEYYLKNKGKGKEFDKAINLKKLELWKSIQK